MQTAANGSEFSQVGHSGPGEVQRPRQKSVGYRVARAIFFGVRNLSIPAPRFVYRPLLWIRNAVRFAWFEILRIFVAEPFFKMSCASYGKGLRTGECVHEVSGPGVIEVGDNVWLDGKSSFAFASRFSDKPRLRIGSHTFIGHQSQIIVGKSVTIGERCLIASNVVIADSNGHPLDPAPRRRGEPPPPDSVCPVTIGDNVWICRRAIIMPGVTVGDDCVVAAGAVVTKDVPPASLVAGIPARVIRQLTPSVTPEGQAEREKEWTADAATGAIEG